MTAPGDEAAIRDLLNALAIGAHFDGSHTDAALAALDRLVAARDEGEAGERSLCEAIRHVIDDSPGTPDSVKRFLSKALAKVVAAMTAPGDEAARPLDPVCGHCGTRLSEHEEITPWCEEASAPGDGNKAARDVALVRKYLRRYTDADSWLAEQAFDRLVVALAERDEYIAKVEDERDGWEQRAGAVKAALSAARAERDTYMRLSRKFLRETVTLEIEADASYTQADLDFFADNADGYFDKWLAAERREEALRRVLEEIEVPVVLADDLTGGQRLAAYRQVVDHHSAIAREALRVDPGEERDAGS